MKKPDLAGSTPNSVEANALLDDEAHDFLTEKLTDKSTPNATLVVGVLRTVEAGGLTANGDRVTKVRLDHLELAFTEKDADDLSKIVKRLAKARTGKSSVDALNPAEDAPIEGMSDAIREAAEADAGDDVE